MKRSQEQVLRSMDRLSANLTRSGLLGYAKRLRGMRTEIAGFGISEKSDPRKDQRLSTADSRRLLRLIMQ